MPATVLDSEDYVSDFWDEGLNMDKLVQYSSGFNSSFTLPYEDFDELVFYRWMFPRWKLAIWLSVIYVILIFSIKYAMKDRERFQLRGMLVAWNLGLAIFSILGAFRMDQEMHHIVSKYGWQFTLCGPTYAQEPFGLWVVLFTLSKAVELGDTVFIVLRKQPLIFLHWYHHIVTMLYVWIAYTERLTSGRWFVTMNYNVHALMYTYYALRAMRFRIPRYVNITITTMQTLQMVVGLAVNAGVYAAKRNGAKCQQTDFNISISLIMYFSYFLLFSYYFYNSYIKSKSKDARESNGAQPVANGYHNGVSNGHTNGHVTKQTVIQRNGYKNGYHHSDVNGNKKGN